MKQLLPAPNFSDFRIVTAVAKITGKNLLACMFALTFACSALAQPITCGDWTFQNPTMAITFYNSSTEIQFPGTSLVYATHGTGMLRSTDDGMTWGTNYCTGTQPTVYETSSSFFLNPNTGWAVGQNGAIFKTTNAGNSWTTQTSGTTQPLYRIFFPDLNNGWAVGENGTILKTANGGNSWSPQVSGTANPLGKVQFASATTGWILNGNSSLLKTTNGGTTWTEKMVASSFFVSDFHFVNATTGWATALAGANWNIYKTTDGGNSWTFQYNAGVTQLSSIFFLNDTEGWALSTTGTVYKTANGATWSVAATGVAAEAGTLRMKNANIGWLVDGASGLLKMTSNGGTTWTTVGTIMLSFNGLAPFDFVSSQQGWSANGNNIYQTNDGGNMFVLKQTLPTASFNQLEMFDANSGLLTSQDKIYRTTNGWDSYVQVYSGTNNSILDIGFVNSQVVFAVGVNGTLLKSVNGGVSFSLLAPPTTKTLRGQFFLDENTGWAVGEDGIILKTTNGGASWSSQASGVTQRLRAVRFLDANNGFIVGYGGMFLKTTNGGATWTPKATGTTTDFASLHFFNANEGWIAGSTIRYTSNGGNSWTTIVSSLPGFASKLLFLDPNLGWAGGTNLLVKYQACVPTQTNITVSICAGDTYTFDGQNLISPGTYTAVFTAANGCDSTVTLALMVLPNLATSLSASICQGTSYPFNGQNLTAGGTYEATLVSSGGCDSTVTLSLMVLPNLATSLSTSICQGTSYLFNGQNLTAGGTYEATLVSSGGCDSTVTLALAVLPSLATSLSASICQGTSYLFDGQALTATGTYSAVYTATNGCDSTVMLTLAVLQADVSVTQTGNTLTAGATGATFQWLDCEGYVPVPGATSAEFVPTASGIYGVQVTQSGCTDTSACFEIILDKVSEEPGLANLNCFPNPFSRALTIDFRSNQPATELTVRLTDFLGRVVWEEVAGSGPTFQRTLDLDGLAPGLYSVTVSSGEEHFSTKILKL